jgi:hypothetical protein
LRCGILPTENLLFEKASIQDRFGLLSLIAIGAANMALASTVRTFPKVRLDLFLQVYGRSKAYITHTLLIISRRKQLYPMS